MRRKHPKLLAFAWMVFVLAFLTVMFSASYFLTRYLYATTNLHPSPLLIQIINSFLGLSLAGVIIGVVSRFSRSRGWVPEMNLFSPILEALERIAKGDFRVRLENTNNDNQMVSMLATSVNKMALELEQIEAMRQEFISNVSHEIQSPLTSIRGFTQALQNDTLSPEDRRHYLTIIETESTRLSRITEDLLKLAALESEHPKFEPKLYRLDKQIRSLILACEPQWLEKKLEMVISLEPVKITADEDLLSQVWTNLLYNSIKFTAVGGQICIDLRAQGDAIEFTIRDNGIGIAPDELPRIFERFYKADKSRIRTNGGSGLGLAIAKKIVAMHAGDICVASTLNSGATFTVTLNAAPPHTP